MTSKEDLFSCESCGIEVTCSKECGCVTSELMCCGRPMVMKTHKKPKSVKRNKGREKSKG